MLLRIDDLEPATFLLLIIFCMAFVITYAIFESNLVIMLGLFSLLLILTITLQILHTKYITIFFITTSLMLYIEFGRDENSI